MQQIDHPLTVFLIGVTGDLSKRKILKALYSLYTQGLLPSDFTLVGNARTPMDDMKFCEFVKEVVQPKDEAAFSGFTKQLHYVAGSATEESTFTNLKQFYNELAAKKNCGNVLWYLATLPKLYEPIINNIGTVGLYRCETGWVKVMMEKPFGTDLTSAQRLNQLVTSYFAEEDIYRIDHFLAKETVQNLMVFRFANGIFEHLWNKEYVEYIQISALETLGIEGREQFYDATGALRDVVQNHILQMLAMSLMEEPVRFDTESVRQQRMRLLSQLEMDFSHGLEKQIAFGQYQAGEQGGEAIAGYLDLEGVDAQSRTETAVALRCFVNNDRWEGVPIYLRAGKRLSTDVTEISVQFKEKQNPFLDTFKMPTHGNILTLRIQPNEGIIIRLKVKKPGLSVEVEDVPMQFCYNTEFQMDMIEAYVKLIYDAVMGEAMLFPRADGIEASWQFIQPILDYKEQTSFQPEPYSPGTNGPESFTQLLQADGHEWIEPSPQVCPVPMTERKK